MTPCRYRPVKFYGSAFAFSWLFWLEAIRCHEGLFCTPGLLLGLVSPAVIAVTPVAQCVETPVVTAAAAAAVPANRDLFFEARHVGRLPEKGTEASR